MLGLGFCKIDFPNKIATSSPVPFAYIFLSYMTHFFTIATFTPERSLCDMVRKGV